MTPAVAPSIAIRKSASASTDAQVLPSRGVVLIAPPRLVRVASDAVAALRLPPVVAGWVSTRSDSAGAEGVEPPYLGTVRDLPALIARLNLAAAVVCIGPEDQAGVQAALHGTRLDARFIPSPEELLRPRVSAPAVTHPRPELSAARNAPHATTFRAHPSIDLGELIGRRPHQIDTESVGRVMTGKRILITGAGGSIGSELCRVAASFEPEQIILMERAENALFEIDRQLARRFPNVPRRAVLHDVVDEEGTLRLLDELRPSAIFHAAAHKHVPLMEDHPGHAITNNLFGTKSIADAAAACGAERFVLISSDKAVNPTSVMGATKRLAELYIRGLAADPRAGGTMMSMVRFGNVLGSACSVLTIWSSQLAEAGPITITDPRMTRYFMTIPEAAALVIQSTVLASDVGVYVLDMGDPIRILELAARFVRMHGLSPRLGEESAARLVGAHEAAELVRAYPKPESGVPSIDIEFTGARPGEKLHEELAYAAEMLAPTRHPGVRSWAGPGFGRAEVESIQTMVSDMAAARYRRDVGGVVEAIRRYVPEMRRRG